ncbi:glycosyltransferase family 2 protein [Candidatus Pseudothioglobus singularis]|nr:glycosyltransferase family 2 protein [Candidatus Pseudothioglobus singularis]
MLISIITVVLNGGKTIEKTIQSVIEQPYKEIQYIIIDGGSSDNTIEIINKYKDRIDTFVSEPDYGLYHAMNKGIDLAKGEVVGMINADDYYYPDIFREVVDSFSNSNLESSIFFGDMYHDGKTVPGWRPNSLKIGAFGAHPSMFVPLVVYKKIGAYKLQYKILSDYDFMYRAFNVYKIKPIYLPKLVAFFNTGGLASKNIFRSYTEEMLIKVDNGQNVGKAFLVYLLKLCKFVFFTSWR